LIKERRPNTRRGNGRLGMERIMLKGPRLEKRPSMKG